MTVLSVILLYSVIAFLVFATFATRVASVRNPWLMLALTCAGGPLVWLALWLVNRYVRNGRIIVPHEKPDGDK